MRANYGYFYDWIPGDIYKQTLLVDGYRQREFNILNPSYPNPGLIGTTPPTNRYLWSDALVLPSAQRASVGVDRALTQNSRINVNYNYGWGTTAAAAAQPERAGGRRASRPGVRQRAGARRRTPSRSRTASTSGGTSAGSTGTARSRSSTTRWSKGDTNTAGAFTLLPGGDNLALEWGPTAGDARHRFSAHGEQRADQEPQRLAQLRRADRDALHHHDRARRQRGRHRSTTGPPARRATRRAARTTSTSADGSPTGGRFGPPRPAAAGGGGQQVVVAMGSGGAGRGHGRVRRRRRRPSDKRYRLDFYVSGQNLLNRVNYTAYSGVMTSPLFGDPIAAGQARRIKVGVRFGF